MSFSEKISAPICITTL